jgi:hypothetical protein
MQPRLATKRLSLRGVCVALPERILFVIVFIYAKVDFGILREQKMAT